MPEKHIAAELRRLIRDQANGTCEYCRSQERFSPQRFSIEHIKPYSAGGQTTQENLALSCQGCNGHKYAKQEAPDPITGAVVALFHPRRETWSDHFAWSADASLIVGLTPVVRATVEALRMESHPTGKPARGMRRRNTLLLNPMKNRDHFDRQLSLLAGEFATTSRIIS